MSDPPLIWLFILLFAASLASSIENRPTRALHVLAGGHLRILNEDSNDSELLTASASGSKDKKKNKKGDDEERKTLSQQVADGRYGLIQKEIFSTPHEKPGVLSYDSNSEIPKDNVNNLGGLNKNEIWLAENHLLVIKGGVYPPHDEKNDGTATVWPVIDDYKAPKRPVKLPAHPKVPPPFPVQLTDDGPLQILGTNTSRTINGSLEEEGYPLPPPEGYVPGTGPFFPPLYPYPPDATAGQAPHPGAPISTPPGDSKLGEPFPPLTPLNGTLPPYFASLPPGAVILPPPNNLTDVYDEDDPSIYYPPPYSFYYPKDNSTKIRPGPLVPGIILPPPPDFFAPLDETTTTTTVTTRRPTQKFRMKTTTKPFKQIRPTTTPVPSTSMLDNKTTKQPSKVLHQHTPTEINNELNPVITTLKPVQKVVTILPVNHASTTRPHTSTKSRQRKPQSGVTILKPIVTKPTTRPISFKLTSKPVNIEATPQPDIYIFNNEVTGKPFAVYGPPPKKKTTTTTQVPVKIYYTTTSNEIETNSVSDIPIKFQSGDAISITKVVKPRPVPPSPSNYYYYDDTEQNVNSVTTPQALQELRETIYNLPEDYYTSDKRKVPPRQQPRYVYSTQRPYLTQKPRYQLVRQTSSRPDTFKVHITRLHKQLNQFYTTPRSYRPVYSSKPVYQYSFQAANYQPQQEQGPVYAYQQQAPPNGFNQQQSPQNGYNQQQSHQNGYNQQQSPPNGYNQQQSPPNGYNQQQSPPNGYNQQQSAPNGYNQQQPLPQSYMQPQFQQHRDFRTPQPIIDDSQDKFRPIPHYSVQIQPAIDLSPTEPPVYKSPAPQTAAYYQTNNEQPVPASYYNNHKPDYDYESAPRQQQYQQPVQKNPSTPRPANQVSFSVTPNPIYQGFYTKPDEGYFDDQTKKYFTVFGKKIPNATTPLPQPEFTTHPPITHQNQARPPQQRPISLAGDTLVNYLQPRPPLNPDAEFIEVNGNEDRSNYQRLVNFNRKPAQYTQQQQNGQYNSRPEVIKAIPIRVNDNDSQRGSYISYELPGDDGAHFYFLTPQLANHQDQGARFYYSQQPKASRVKRNERSQKDSFSESAGR